jgi:hypothetical protein
MSETEAEPTAKIEIGANAEVIPAAQVQAEKEAEKEAEEEESE